MQKTPRFLITDFQFPDITTEKAHHRGCGGRSGRIPVQNRTRCHSGRGGCRCAPRSVGADHWRGNRSSPKLQSDCPLWHWTGQYRSRRRCAPVALRFAISPITASKKSPTIPFPLPWRSRANCPRSTGRFEREVEHHSAASDARFPSVHLCHHRLRKNRARRASPRQGVRIPACCL